MTTIKHISPSSLYTFEHSYEEFYNRYFIGTERMPPTPAMRLGSVFDAQVKSWLLDTLCEYRDTDESINNSATRILAEYKLSAAGLALFDQFTKSTDAACDVEVRGEIGGVPILGYIDSMWGNGSQYHILDWKVGKIPPRARPYWLDQLHIYGMLTNCRSLYVHLCNLDGDGQVMVREFHPAWDDKLAVKLTARIKHAWKTAHDPAWHSLFSDRARLLSESGDIFHYFRKFGMN